MPREGVGGMVHDAANITMQTIKMVVLSFMTVSRMDFYKYGLITLGWTKIRIPGLVQAMNGGVIICLFNLNPFKPVMIHLLNGYE